MTGPAPADDRDRLAVAWVDQVRAALTRTLADADRAPRDRDVEALIELIDRGRRHLDDPRSLTRATAEGIGGAVFELIAISRARDEGARGRGEEPSDLLPQLMFFALRPYLGVDLALAELRRCTRERPPDGKGSASWNTIVHR
ncbi:MAG TPA: hypothetical protein VG898_11180 [Solirubrobacterales bacterium]|nr:hypothetical protein [Solirubrobacterales bacterium]